MPAAIALNTQQGISSLVVIILLERHTTAHFSLMRLALHSVAIGQQISLRCINMNVRFREIFGQPQSKG